MSTTEALTKADFKSDRDVRWCPGCGDYSILNSLQTVMAELEIPREEFVVISGIGCSSRFPYYMGTYGFHSIHGRAPAIATGTKVANPDLSVWVVTGDGDGLSIGGNHMIHALRRNVDLKILLFNNEIYGLTKGQYSPTSPVGTVSKSSPLGSIDRPFNPVTLALGARATFVARTTDAMPKHMNEIFRAAARHKGSAFIEIWQNCVIFNNHAYAPWTERAVRDEKIVDLRPGEPMIYGKTGDKGIAYDCGEPKKVLAGEASVWRADTPTPAPAMVVAEMDAYPDLPRAIGIFRSVDQPVYDLETRRQVQKAIEDGPPADLKDLIYTKDVWDVK